MEFSTSIGKLSDDDHSNILLIWQQLQKIQEETEDEIRRLKRTIEELQEQVNRI